MRRSNYKAKRCPRCGTKNHYTSFKCAECGLIFSRVENGSNKLAKGLILSGKSNEVVKAPMFPKDVSKKTFLFLCGFLGFFGAHNFYVGRYVKAVFQIIVGLGTLILTVLSSAINIEYIMSFAFLPVSIDGIMWFFDFCDGIFNKYKIPVAVDFTDGKNLMK
ncbi:MAG: TM2 domain-containing protein [Clostridiales bacterium]|nr:TM2 domain-containing protein [Clostridiales bacterium]